MTQIGEAIAVLFGAPPPSTTTKPTIVVVKWMRKKIVPLHNKSWPPSSPPTDAAVPPRCKAAIYVETANVPEGTGASITIHHCKSGANVKDGEIKSLKVVGGVVRTDDGRLPTFSFEAEHELWDPWDAPFYYCKVKVEHQGLKGESSRDYQGSPDEVLRVLYLHASVSDAIADTPAGGGLTTRAEMNEIAGIFAGDPNSRVYRRAFNKANVSVALWGSVLRNTYAYHHASHGDLESRTTRASNPGPPPNPPANVAGGPWRSVVVLGNSTFGDTEVQNTGAVPSVPRYLVYMDTCVAGWESSLGDAFVKRGTQNYVAFRKYIPDNAARTMARNFYNRWVKDYGCDPARIPQVFWDTGAPFYGSMRPVLIGRGGGEIHKAGVVNAIRGAVAGFAALF